MKNETEKEKNLKEKEEKKTEKSEEGRPTLWNLTKAYSLTILAVIVAITAFYALVSWVISIPSLIETPEGLAQLLIAGIFMSWLLSCLRVVDRYDQGNKFFFGKMGEEYVNKETGKVCGIMRLFYGYCGSGLHLVLRLPFCGIAKITKERLRLDFAPRVTISKKTVLDNGEKFGKQFLMIDGGVYTEFKRDFWGMKNAIERKTPTTEEGLVGLTDILIDSAYREAIGSMDWGTATEKEGRDVIAGTVQERIENSNSIFSLGGLDIDKTTVGIKVVDLQSEDLKKSIVRPDVERFQEEGAVYEAGRIRKEAEVIGEIRETLKAKGFSEGNIDKIAHDVYELQVSKDLQKETRIPVVKIIRWEGSSGVASLMGQMMTGMTIGKELISPEKATEKKDKEEKKSEQKGEEEEFEAGMKALKL